MLLPYGSITEACCEQSSCVKIDGEERSEEVSLDF